MAKDVEDTSRGIQIEKQEGTNAPSGTATGVYFGDDWNATHAWDYGIDFSPQTFTAEMIMATKDAGSLPCIIASGTATDDAGIVSDVGADSNWADGSLYISVSDGAGKLFQKQNDVWVDLQA